MQAFTPGDLAAGLKDIGLDEVNDKPFSRRGVLSTVNSLFEPSDLVVPVTIQGRALLRELSAEANDWDTELPRDQLHK